MPSDREIEAAAKAIAELSEAFAYDGSEDDYHREMARRALSAAATARPDQGAVQELYEAAKGLLMGYQERRYDRLAAACEAYERASLGEGSVEAEQ